MHSIAQTYDRQITEVVHSWPGVTSGIGRRGELSFKLGAREIGHLHGDRVAHLGFPKPLWRRLMAEGVIEEHPVVHEGWGARPLRTPKDVEVVLELLRLNYDAFVAKHGLPDAA